MVAVGVVVAVAVGVVVVVAVGVAVVVAVAVGVVVVVAVGVAVAVGVGVVVVVGVGVAVVIFQRKGAGMKLWYCEYYNDHNYFIGPDPVIEQYYIMETELGTLIEFNEEGERIGTWDDWSDFEGGWKDKKVFDKDFIKVRVL